MMTWAAVGGWPGQGSRAGARYCRRAGTWYRKWRKRPAGMAAAAAASAAAPPPPGCGSPVPSSGQRRRRPPPVCLAAAMMACAGGQASSVRLRLCVVMRFSSARIKVPQNHSLHSRHTSYHDRTRWAFKRIAPRAIDSLHLNIAQLRHIQLLS